MSSTGRPQVVAHRGSSKANAEHTLGAYIAALDEGAEALECDVRLTADQVGTERLNHSHAGWLNVR